MLLLFSKFIFFTTGLYIRVNAEFLIRGMNSSIPIFRGHKNKTHKQ